MAQMRKIPRSPLEEHSLHRVASELDPFRSYFEEACELATWRERAIRIYPLADFHPDIKNFVFCIHRFSVSGEEDLIMFYEPELCIDWASRVYKMASHDFKGFKALARATIDDTKRSGTFWGAGAGCFPSTTSLRMVDDNSDGPKHLPRFVSASFTAFRPCHPRYFTRDNALEGKQVNKASQKRTAQQDENTDHIGDLSYHGENTPRTTVEADRRGDVDEPFSRAARGKDDEEGYQPRGLGLAIERPLRLISIKALFSLAYIDYRSPDRGPGVSGEAAFQIERLGSELVTCMTDSEIRYRKWRQRHPADADKPDRRWSWVKQGYGVGLPRRSWLRKSRIAGNEQVAASKAQKNIESLISSPSSSTIDSKNCVAHEDI